MSQRELFADFDWSKYRLTPFRVVTVCSILLGIAIVVSIAQFSQARDNILPGGAPIGGDYVVFYGAAIAAADGQAAMTYDPVEFENHLLAVGPPREDYKLTWQYPPTYFLLVLPLAFLPFIPGYIAWSGGTAALYFVTMRGVGFKELFLFVILASPSAFQAVITGQNGFLTATLITVAALYPDKRPIVAGLCAALLTFKPQLGVLLPIAFIALGCWRAFLVAAAGAIAFAGAATGVLGQDIWIAFQGGAAEVSTRMTGNIMPMFKMVTPYAWTTHLGFPFATAMLFHSVCAVVATIAVFRVWKTVPDRELRAAALCAGVFFVAPYGYYYELIILALPVAVLAKRGLQNGWMRWEEATIALMFILPMMLPGEQTKIGLGFGFICVAVIAAGVVRRIEHDYPGTFSVFQSIFTQLQRKAQPEN